MSLQLEDIANKREAIQYKTKGKEWNGLCLNQTEQRRRKSKSSVQFYFIHIPVLYIRYGKLYSQTADVIQFH